MTTDYSEFGWSDAQPAFYHELLCKYIERLLPADGSPILDVGCGNGFTANYLAGKGYDVYGIDAGLAAGIFHQKLLTIHDLKTYLNENGVEMRL